MNDPNLLAESNRISRRQLFQWAGAGLMINVAGTLLYDPIGRLSMPVNEALGKLILSSKLTPEFAIAQIEPEKLIINSYRGTPSIDLQNFKLTISGAVNNPIGLNLPDIYNLPFTSMVIRQVCVEGWAAIVQWGGVKLSDLLGLSQPKSSAKYVYFKSADGYYESWDLASSVHPQTLLAYQMNGQDLPKENGAPLRLASPIKLGYKQSKWVTDIIVTSELLPKRGYWEDLGYEWFAGL